jgi:hypothetical protein
VKLLILRVFVVRVSVLKLFTIEEFTIITFPNCWLKNRLLVLRVSVLIKKLHITGLTRLAILPLTLEIEFVKTEFARKLWTLTFVAVIFPSIVQVADLRFILPSSSIAFQGIVKAP